MLFLKFIGRSILCACGFHEYEVSKYYGKVERYGCKHCEKWIWLREWTEDGQEIIMYGSKYND